MLTRKICQYMICPAPPGPPALPPRTRNVYERVDVEPTYESMDELNICPSAETLKDAKVTLHNGNVKRQVDLPCLKKLLSDPPDVNEGLYSSIGSPLQASTGGKKRKRKTVRKSKKSKSLYKHKKTGKIHAKRHSKTMKRKGKQHHKRRKSRK